MRYELAEREHQLIATISQLGQLDTAHIKTLHYSDVSRQRMDLKLKELRDDKLIRQVGTRTTGGKRGTAPGVYILGPKGWWYMNRHGDYPSITAVRTHTLHIADIFTRLVELDRAGVIKLDPETEVEHVMGSIRADIYINMEIVALQKRRRLIVEQQEHARPDLIKQKLEAHWDAYNYYTGERKYPPVVFVCRDDYIKFRINKLVQPKQRQLVFVYTLDEFLKVATSVSGLVRLHDV